MGLDTYLKKSAALQSRAARFVPRKLQTSFSNKQDDDVANSESNQETVKPEPGPGPEPEPEPEPELAANPETPDADAVSPNPVSLNIAIADAPNEDEEAVCESPTEASSFDKLAQQLRFEKLNSIDIDSLISEKLSLMPIRVIDTWFGTFCDGDQLRFNFKHSSEYIAVEKAKDWEKMRSLADKYFEFAMLSHRWGDGEPLFRHVDREIRDERCGSIYMMKAPAGVQKLQHYCCTAAKCGYRWAWSDTCCIDKSSSSETQESINSMFSWYRNSALTIVHLSDMPDMAEVERIPSSPSVDSTFPPYSHEPPPEPRLNANSDYPPPVPNSALGKFVTLDTMRDEECLGKAFFEPDDQIKDRDLEPFLQAYLIISPWFKRGWTLQELLAPKNIRFYSENWKSLEREDKDHLFANQKQDPIWLKALAHASGIDEDTLVKLEPVCENIRERLRWAADRKTTKVEDIAYCLMGLFGISMPILYGEGASAFTRLQEEIMKRSDDLSLFDWTGKASSLNSCLASHPSCFKEHSTRISGSAPPKEAALGFLHALSGAGELVTSALPGFAFDRFKKLFKDPPPGHSLVNGEMMMSLFEYRATKIEFIEQQDSIRRYTITAKGLQPFDIFTHQELDMKDPSRFYVARVWDRTVGRVIQTISSSISSTSARNSNDTLAAALRPILSSPETIKRALSNPKSFRSSSGSSTFSLTSSTTSMLRSMSKRFDSSDGTERSLSQDEIVESPQASISIDPSTPELPADQEVKVEEGRKKLAMSFVSSFYKPFVAQLVYKDGKKIRKRIATENRIVASYAAGFWDFGLATKLRNIH
ncbi:heterokaryon incompatibility protein-domain-containing protein [Hygrophoropsis aurantiaca]|uniref:Heterokaryon incompatibility protein-domain-containing protein n=1 Tax=Hygrophoropsis aurantiaca TaxID=72124 RepID=A0ACB8AT70_9AGAM|nr:heterokaryon incompatibility protein-domain-containing protein [Hygrophoropsis aurantiaca]